MSCTRSSRPMRTRMRFSPGCVRGCADLKLVPRFGSVASRAVFAALALSTLGAPPRATAQPRPSRIAQVLEGAYQQVGRTLHYDGSYRLIAFPGGDVPIERGVCTDVLVRAYRRAGVDLQLLVNQDMSQAFGSYPPLWGLSRPDPNIDHRRVPNLATFFRRHGEVVT